MILRIYNVCEYVNVIIKILTFEDKQVDTAISINQVL